MCDQSSNRLMDSFARHHLAALPHGSIALTSGDLQYYPLLYLQLCENVRRDVQVVNTAMMKGEWFLEKQGKTHFRDISFPAPVYMPGVTTCSESLYNIRCLLEENPSPLWTKQRKRKQKGGGGGSRNALGKAGRVMILRRWPPGDLSFEGAFEEWPRGLAREVMPATTGKAPLLRGSALIEWIEESVATLPPIQVYPSFQPLLPPLSPFGNATLPLWDPSSRREQPTVVECLWEMLQGVLWPLEKNVWHARHGGGGGMQARAGAERWGTAPSLDNWEMAAVEEVLAAHTAMSKFVISILRDRHQEFGVASNHTRLSKLSVQLASQVSEALPNEPSSLKNLGARHGAGLRRVCQYLARRSPHRH
ncbi:hypothetical protein T484DRAFT_2913304 [Baffinella frigidus]|nr:hypothetical protein T484DRAFT_2913304 [Cryptophyta sp. CCMP2293]